MTDDFIDKKIRTMLSKRMAERMVGTPEIEKPKKKKGEKKPIVLSPMTFTLPSR